MADKLVLQKSASNATDSLHSSRPGTSGDSPELVNLLASSNTEQHLIEAFVFNPEISNPYPSTSPRDQLSYRRDKGNMLDAEKYAIDHPELALLVNHIRSEVLKNKPSNVVDYLCENVFTKDKIKEMKANFRK